MYRDNSKPSDASLFFFKVHEASNTTLDLMDFIETYRELLQILFFNPDIDLPNLMELK